MTLAILLIALLIDRLVWHAEPARRHRWFDRYSDRLLSLATGQWLARLDFGALWLILPLVIVVALAQGLLDHAAGVVFGVLVLLLSLGPRDIGRQLDAYEKAVKRGDERHAGEEARELAGDDVPAQEPGRTLAAAQGALCTALPRLFAPMFWFALLGPVGAALYRLARLTLERVASRESAPAALTASCDHLVALLDWLPTRGLVAAYGVTGRLEATRLAWQRFRTNGLGTADNRRLICEAGTVAMRSWPDAEELAAGDHPPVLDEARSLIWRSLATWLGALLLLTLLGALA